MPYSTLFYRDSANSGDTTLYTVPAGYKAVLRDLEIFNGTGHVLSVSNIQTGPGSPTALLWISGALGTDATYQWKGRVVLNAGDVVVLFAEYDTLHVTLSGYLLSAP